MTHHQQELWPHQRIRQDPPVCVPEAGAALPGLQAPHLRDSPGRSLAAAHGRHQVLRGRLLQRGCCQVGWTNPSKLWVGA